KDPSQPPGCNPATQARENPLADLVSPKPRASVAYRALDPTTRQDKPTTPRCVRPPRRRFPRRRQNPGALVQTLRSTDEATHCLARVRSRQRSPTAEAQVRLRSQRLEALGRLSNGPQRRAHPLAPYLRCIAEADDTTRVLELQGHALESPE